MGRGLGSIERAMFMRAFFAQKAVVTVTDTALLTVMTTVYWFQTLTAALLESCCIWQCSSGQHMNQGMLVTGWVGSFAGTAEIVLAESASEVGRVVRYPCASLETCDWHLRGAIGLPDLQWLHSLQVEKALCS